MPLPRIPMLSRMSILFCSLSLILLAQTGCAGPGSSVAQQAAEVFDPLEDTNRSIFTFNQSVDGHVLIPVAEGYRSLPAPVRDSVHDFLQNLNGPITFANDVLQGEPELATNTLGRFAINTTAGVGGLFDVATQ
jgi:phospholipid-binding lipoprotein MlaA